MLTALQGMHLALCTLHAPPHCTAQVAPCTAHTARTTCALHSLCIAVCTLHAHTSQHVPHSVPTAHTACTYLTALLTPPPVHNVCMHLTAMHSSYPAPCMPHTHLSLNTTLHDSIPAAHTACTHITLCISLGSSHLPVSVHCMHILSALHSLHLALCTLHAQPLHSLHLAVCTLHAYTSRCIPHCTSHASCCTHCMHTPCCTAQLTLPTASVHGIHSLHSQQLPR